MGEHCERRRTHKKRKGVILSTNRVKGSRRSRLGVRPHYPFTHDVEWRKVWQERWKCDMARLEDDERIRLLSGASTMLTRIVLTYRRQFFVRVADADVSLYLQSLTLLSVE